MYENTIKAIEQYAPGIRSLIVGKEVLTPEDLENRYGLDEGQLYHVEHAADQLLVRPTYECARYATPIAGLFLCGSGSHPGGGITCAPGALAVDAMI
jgi:phytoene dehydrogenase-like protein